MEAMNKQEFQQETQKPEEAKSEIKKMSYKWVELSADNKLTQKELKTIENLLNTDLKEIQKETKWNLDSLKKIVLEDLKSRMERSPNKYISSLIEKTEKHLQTTESQKTETKEEESNNVAESIAKTDQNINIPSLEQKMNEWNAKQEAKNTQVELDKLDENTAEETDK